MSEYRKTLSLIVAVLAFVGIVLAVIPFVKSLEPSERAQANKVACNLPSGPNLQPGHILRQQITKSTQPYRYDNRWLGGYGKQRLIVRDYDGTFYSYQFPTRGGKVVMPIVVWGQWEGECKNFGPRMNGNKIVKGSNIQCNDSDLGNWPARHAKWTLAGKSLNKPFPDLPIIRCRNLASIWW